MLTDIETAVFYFFNRTCRSTILDNLLLFITELGSGKFLLVLAVIMLFVRKERLRTAGILLLAGQALCYNTVYLLKNLLARPRPFVSLPDAAPLFIIDGFSFPSGHAAMAFMAAVILSRYFGRKYIFYSAATVVAISRIYLGFHFPSDVFIGGCIGLLLGCILVRIAESVAGGRDCGRFSRRRILQGVKTLWNRRRT